MPNLYATLDEYKAYVTARKQHLTKTVDNADDNVIRDLLASASRYFERKTGRTFYPQIVTEYYDVPLGRELDLGNLDLLEVISLLNGEDTAITSSDYNLLPYRGTPKYAIKLLQSSGVAWQQSSAGNTEGVIDLNAWIGYHDDYSGYAWQSVGTLGAAISDTTTKAFTMTAGHTITKDMILKIDNEIYNVSNVDGTTVTPLKRGDNGSTAATHLISTDVYAWYVMDDVKDAILSMTQHAYKRRFGDSQSEVATVTPVGVMLAPVEIPKKAADLMSDFRRTI